MKEELEEDSSGGVGSEQWRRKEGSQQEIGC